MGKNELPLDLRIDLAEAFVELSWAQVNAIPPSRGGHPGGPSLPDWLMSDDDADPEWIERGTN